MIVVEISAEVVCTPASEDDLAFGFGAHIVEDVLSGTGPVGGIEEVDGLIPVIDVQDDAGIEEGEGAHVEGAAAGDVNGEGATGVVATEGEFTAGGRAGAHVDRAGARFDKRAAQYERAAPVKVRI